LSLMARACWLRTSTGSAMSQKGHPFMKTAYHSAGAALYLQTYS
jgi:hypothetical protein